MSYFDVTNTDCLELLPPPFRTHPHLEYAAATAEREVKEWFRRENTAVADGYNLSATAVNTPVTHIALHLYTDDASLCTDAELVQAIQYEVANILTYRFETGRISASGAASLNPLVTEVRHDRRSYKFGQNTSQTSVMGLPPDFPRYVNAWHQLWKYFNEPEKLTP